MSILFHAAGKKNQHKLQRLYKNKTFKSHGPFKKVIAKSQFFQLLCDYKNNMNNNNIYFMVPEISILIIHGDFLGVNVYN